MSHSSIFRRKLNSLLLILVLAISCSCTDRSQIALSDGNPAEKQIDRAGKNNRLQIIKKRGNLICGINDKLLGFSYKEKDATYSGLSVDLCKAIAAAIFGDSTKVEFRHLNSKQRFQAVSSGEVDILSRNTTWTLSRDTTEGLDFPPTNFYDGQGLLTVKDSGIKNLEDLNGKSICVAANTTSENNLAIQARKNSVVYTPLLFENAEQMFESYESGKCDVTTGDRSELIARRVNFANREAHEVLDLVFSKEPLGPVIANGEPEWFDVVEWVSYATIKAEELGINSQNVDSFGNTENPTIARFLGMGEDDLGKNIGLPKDFAAKIIKQVGNYGEIYERNIGEPFGLDRGANNLVQNGGLIYSPPFR